MHESTCKDILHACSSWYGKSKMAVIHLHNDMDGFTVYSHPEFGRSSSAFIWIHQQWQMALFKISSPSLSLLRKTTFLIVGKFDGTYLVSLATFRQMNLRLPYSYDPYYRQSSNWPVQHFRVQLPACGRITNHNLNFGRSVIYFHLAQSVSLLSRLKIHFKITRLCSLLEFHNSDNFLAQFASASHLNLLDFHRNCVPFGVLSDFWAVDQSGHFL